MDTHNLVESLLRWIHVLAGIAWIGHLYFFNWVNGHFAATLDAETKRKVVPELMPRALFWFRWGAAFTWVTGIVLLVLVFYHGRLTLARPEDGWNALAIAMIVLTLLGFLLYDVLVKTVLRNPKALFVVGFLLIAGYVVAMKQAGFSYRGYMIHLGGMLGTAMAWNVWFRIWPAQRKIIAAVKAGTPPDAALVASAGARSRHNTYMSVPLVFVMLNQHNTWVATGDDPVPYWLLLVTLVGWFLVMHLYGVSKKVKGF